MSLAGAGYNDAARCRPSQPVHVLQVHGTADAVVLYAGGAGVVAGGSPYPSAERTVSDWAARNGCGAMRQSAGEPLDIEGALAGAETTREAHAGCRAGGSAELWAIRGGAHLPAFNPQWSPRLIDWLYAHGRAP
jgi:polyhydroxybutyrate depolymerase